MSVSKLKHEILGENIMAVAVVKQSAKSVKVFIPGSQNDIWYKTEKTSVWSFYAGGNTVDIPVDINSVSNHDMIFYL